VPAALAVLATVCLLAAAAAGYAAPPLDQKYGPEAPFVSAPTSVPDRIVLSWTGDPATSRAVTWRTGPAVRKAFAEIAFADPSPKFYEGARRLEARSELLLGEGPPARYHSIVFDGLRPDTWYAYRVGSDKGWSEWFQFRTAKGAHAPFSFLYVGDSQSNTLAMWSRVVRAAHAAAPDARFLLAVGDLVSDGANDEQWGEWFRAAGWVPATVPFFSAIGNHEYINESTINKHWRSQFTLPENGIPGLEETCYFTDCDGMRLVVLNSNVELEKQASWLGGVLARNANKWTVVAFHHPVYSGTGDRDNKDVRRLWKPVFDRFGVDLVLQGHDHVYARGRGPSGWGAPRGDEADPVYVVSVSGPKMYERTEDRWMDRAGENTQLYQVVSVEGDTLRFRSYTATNDLYDAFDIVKPAGSEGRFVDRAPMGAPDRGF
jgi:hypothetical protein